MVGDTRFCRSLESQFVSENLLARFCLRDSYPLSFSFDEFFSLIEILVERRERSRNDIPSGISRDDKSSSMVVSRFESSMIRKLVKVRGSKIRDSKNLKIWKFVDSKNCRNLKIETFRCIKFPKLGATDFLPTRLRDSAKNRENPN